MPILPSRSSRPQSGNPLTALVNKALTSKRTYAFGKVLVTRSPSEGNMAKSLLVNSEGSNDSIEEPSEGNMANLAILLLKPTPETVWGVSPGRDPFCEHVIVASLSPDGIAKDQLVEGDRIVSIDGIEVRGELHLVELLNTAHEVATATSGCSIEILRQWPDIDASVHQSEIISEIELFRPTAASEWGVMPGRLNDKIVVHRLSQSGLARSQLAVGDILLAVGGVPIDCEMAAVDAINESHRLATPTSGAKIIISRQWPGTDTRGASDGRPQQNDLRNAKASRRGPAIRGISHRK